VILGGVVRGAIREAIGLNIESHRRVACEKSHDLVAG
jgi:hypothetical protein